MAAFLPVTAFKGLSVGCGYTKLDSIHRQVFRPRRARAATLVSPPQCTLTLDRIANKSYQLEEDEDEMSCTSAVFLQEDGTVTIGKTDGPAPDDIKATWDYNASDGELVLDIERYFGSDSGVPFCVKRILRGHLDDSRKNLEDLPVFAGAMYQHPADFSKHSEIGWFAMILAVDDLPSVDFDISAQ